MPGARGRRDAPSASASASSSSSPIPGRSSPTSTTRATRSRGKVRSLTDYGVFVGIEEGVDGMVHKTRPLVDGQRSTTRPTSTTRATTSRRSSSRSTTTRRRSRLGIKQLYDDPWLRSAGQLPGRARCSRCASKSIADFGVFVEIERGVEGLVHVVRATPEDVARRRREPASRTATSSRPRSSRWIAEERRIALSFKRAFEREETAEALKFMERAREKGGARGRSERRRRRDPGRRAQAEARRQDRRSWPRSSAALAASGARAGRELVHDSAVGAAAQPMRYRVARGGRAVMSVLGRA